MPAALRVPADGADAVDGVKPVEVAHPTGPEELRQVMLAAQAENWAVVPRGAGTKIDWGGAPERAEMVVDVSALDQPCQHLAGDLVAVVGAGVRLADLQTVLAGAGQRLAVDEVVPGSSIGGIIATGLCGPLRFGYGALRDLLLGVSVVKADATLVHAGGRVVKNVAGYDLTKLYTGSFGTLGVITQAIFRLHPLPAASSWVVAGYGDGRSASGPLEGVLTSQVAPAAVEIDSVRGPGGGMVVVAVLIDGGRLGVSARAAKVAGLLGPTAEVTDEPPRWWAKLAGTTTVKLSLPLGTVPTVVDAVGLIADDLGVEVTARGSAGVGVIQAGVEASEREVIVELVAALRSLVQPLGGSAVVLRAPLETKSSLDIWGPVPAIGVMRRIKQQWDPQRRLAPGRFVGGI
jgi:glycolate oxidase FAD binding subunit